MTYTPENSKNNTGRQRPIPAPQDLPWPVAGHRPRDDGFAPEVWHQAEAHRYRGLLAAAQAVVLFGERLKSVPAGVAERFALGSVAAQLRAEGVWLGPQQIALYRALRIASDDTAQDLGRASWAVRRLIGPVDPLDGAHAFLGRTAVRDPQEVPGTDRPVGPELDALSDHWRAAVLGLGDVHPLTRAAFAHARWQATGMTPFGEGLEPAVAAMLIGADGLAPFVPLVAGHPLERAGASDRPESGLVESGLAAFYAAARAGALNALSTLDRLADWQAHAALVTGDLSGRTPPLLIGAVLRFPVLSADLAAQSAGCSRPAARRNLALFAQRGLIREVTGQDRYRFWTIRA